MKSQHDLAYRLVQLAARRAPPALAERLQEEWSADLESRSGTLSRLRLALECWWATGVITRDLAVPQAALTTSGNAKALLGTSNILPQLSRRTVALLAIAGVHLLVFYVFVSGLAQHVTHTFSPTPQVTITQEDRPHQTPPPLDPNPTVVGSTHPDLPLPQDFTLPNDDRPPADFPIISGSNTTPETESPAPAPPIHRVAGGPGTGFPNPDDYYPSAARRLGETGTTIVQVCVDTLGRLTAVPTVVGSSGSRRLDDGALTLARAGSGHYLPTTENGRAVSACYPYRIHFRLTD